MENQKSNYKTVDEYISLFPEHVREKLIQIRKLIREQVPDAKEKISYQMPAFFLNGALVYFGAFSKHIGFYPTASGIAAFEKEFSKYQYSKGAVRFPLNEQIPEDLIKRIILFRVKENLDKKKKE